MDNPYEGKLLEVGEKLGELMSKASDSEKDILRAMKKRVDDYAESVVSEGKYIDRSAIFAAGIIAHPEINDEGMINAAREYVEVDYLFIKHYKEAGVQS
jgi:hypothetical protein